MIVTNVGGGAVDAAASGAQVVAGRDQLRERPGGVQTNGAVAYGKVVWIRRLNGRRQVSTEVRRSDRAGVPVSREATEARKPDTPG